MEQIRSGEFLHNAMQKKQEEKRKLKKEHKFHPRDRNIESKFFIFTLTLYFLFIVHDS